jgi:hypothetical protein
LQLRIENVRWLRRLSGLGLVVFALTVAAPSFGSLPAAKGPPLLVSESHVPPSNGALATWELASSDGCVLTFFAVSLVPLKPSANNIAGFATYSFDQCTGKGLYGYLSYDVQVGSALQFSPDMRSAHLHYTFTGYEEVCDCPGPPTAPFTVDATFTATGPISPEPPTTSGRKCYSGYDDQGNLLFDECLASHALTRFRPASATGTVDSPISGSLALPATTNASFETFTERGVVQVYCC